MVKTNRSTIDYSKLPTVTNSKGAKQSSTLGRFDLIPGSSMRRLASILDYGAGKYGENNWHGLELSDHINHALEHLFAYLEGNTSEDHLGHAMTRMIFAVWKEEEENIAKKLCDEGPKTDEGVVFSPRTIESTLR